MPAEGSMMASAVEALRLRLATSEKSLQNVRKKVADMKAEAAKPAVKSTISSIQQRYMAAVADLESKGKDHATFVVGKKGDGVASLASKWNEGIEGKKVEKTRVNLRADINGVKKNFGKGDAPKVGGRGAAGGGKKKGGNMDYGPSELEVEDDEAGLPSWATNQKRKTLKKENARSSVRDVDVKDLQGSVLEMGARDGSEAHGEKVEVVGNVKAALAMWGKSAEEDALVLKKKKEEEDKLKEIEERKRIEREQEEKKRKMDEAVERFAKLELADLGNEPNDEIDLLAYLERKIVLVERDIEIAEKEMDLLENGADS